MVALLVLARLNSGSIRVVNRANDTCPTYHERLHNARNTLVRRTGLLDTGSTVGLASAMMPLVLFDRMASPALSS